MTGSNLMGIFTQKNITEIYQFENCVNSEKLSQSCEMAKKAIQRMKALLNEQSWLIHNIVAVWKCIIIWIEFPRIGDLVLQVNLNI